MNSAVSNLRAHCSPIVKVKLFFYSAGPLSFLLSFSFSFPVLHSVSPFLCSLSLPLLDVSASLSDKTQAGASSQADFFFFFFTQRSLSALSFSLLSLCFADERALPIVGCRWLWFGDCGHGSWVRWLWSSGGDGGFFFLFFFFFFFFLFCVVLLVSDWAPIVQGRHKTTCYQIFDLILGLDLVGVGLDLFYRCEGGRQAVPWKKMTTGKEMVFVSCGFWFGVMGLLVAVMVEVSFLSFFLFLLWLVVVSGCGGCGWMWMWRFLPAVIFFFFSLFVSGGCGMGGGFWVGGW